MDGDGKGGRIKMILWIGWEEERKVREREGGVRWGGVRSGGVEYITVPVVGIIIVTTSTPIIKPSKHIK